MGTLAFGAFAQARGNFATALGYSSFAPALQATAVGNGAQATGENAAALGRAALARADNATALGTGATADFNGSTAVGTGATTTADNQVMLGGSGSSVVIADIASSTAAQQGPVDVVTVDANGVLGRQQAATTASVTRVRDYAGHIAAVSDAQFQSLSRDVSALGGRIDGLAFRLEDLNKRAIGGVAAAMAMGQGKIVPDSGISMTLAASTYGGEEGFAAMLSGRLREKVYVSAGISGNTGDETVGGTVSATFGF